MGNISSLTLTVDSSAIPSNQIYGYIKISRKENESSNMEVTIVPPSGVQNMDNWRGKSVVLNVNGTVVYTGAIDTPAIDLIYKRITFRCTDKRRETLNTDLAGTISTIGYYSGAIFQKPENVIDELDQRLTTTPEAVDLKPDGNYAITSINPKTVEDITLTNSDILRKSLSVSETNRGRLTNQVNLNFKYRYTRLRHRELAFSIEGDTFCYVVQNDAQLRFWLKSTFEQNAEQLAWPIDPTSITWTELPPSQNVNALCSLGYDFIVYTSKQYAEKMGFNAATRFTQTVTEDFSITVTAPQSISQYGLIDWNQDNGYSVEYDTRQFEIFDTYAPPTGMTSDPNDYYLDQDGVSTDFDDAVVTAINIAKTKIIRSHRDTQVSFDTQIRVDFDLTKTIYLNTAGVQARGKITSIEHNIDITNRYGTTTTEISLSTATGTQTPDSIVPPTRPSVPVVADTITNPVVLPFSILNGTGSIDTPAIDAISRNEHVVAKSDTYNIEIQNDLFQVTL